MKSWFSIWLQVCFNYDMNSWRSSMFSWAYWFLTVYSSIIPSIFICSALQLVFNDNYIDLALLYSSLPYSSLLLDFIKTSGLLILFCFLFMFFRYIYDFLSSFSLLYRLSIIPFTSSFFILLQNTCSLMYFFSFSSFFIYFYKPCLCLCSSFLVDCILNICFSISFI